MNRPLPPASILEIDVYGSFIPAPEVEAWVNEAILPSDGVLYNEDHSHLQDARIGFLWTSAPNTSKGRQVIGQAEIPSFKCGKWQRARQEQQIREWFGCLPDFIITLDAIYCSQCSDVEFLALVEHELYHCGHALDEYGTPRFNRETGLPIYALKGHDVEEFVGVVRRYGVISDAVRDLILAAAQPPQVGRLNIAMACGTCQIKAA